jgi:putative transposase
MQTNTHETSLSTNRKKVVFAKVTRACKRDLSEQAIVYPFVDGIAERLRPGQRREAVLAWAFSKTDAKVSLGLMAGSKRRRDGKSLLPGSARVVSAIRFSSYPTARRGIEECFPRSARQRSLAHRMREVAVKVPTELWPEFKARVTLLSGAVAGDHAPTGDRHPRPLRGPSCRARSPVSRVRRPPAAAGHQSPLHSNDGSLERLFVKERRRLKTIPNGFGEKPVLKLMFGALIGAAERWRGLRFTEFELRQLAAVRKELNEEYGATLPPDHPSPVFPASPRLDRLTATRRRISNKGSFATRLC